MPNADEARQLTGEHDLDLAAATLAQFTPSVVIKNGRNGVHGVHHGVHYHVSARVADPVGLTGAGDSFNACFVFGFCRGEGSKAATRLGSVTGSFATEGLGGETLPDAETLLAEGEKLAG